MRKKVKKKLWDIPEEEVWEWMKSPRRVFSMGKIFKFSLFSKILQGVLM